MAHAEEPDFIFWWNRRVHLNQHGCQFSRLLAAEMCASAVVMVDTPCYKVVWRVLATHSIHQFPLHFPSCASPCAITFQLESTIMPVHTGFLSVRTPMFGAAVKRRYCMSTSNQTCTLCWILHNFEQIFTVKLLFPSSKSHWKSDATIVTHHSYHILMSWLYKMTPCQYQRIQIS